MVCFSNFSNYNDYGNFGNHSMNQPRSQASPGFYKFMAVVFFVLGGVFIWAAVHQHSWFFGAFGIITILNGLMSILKSLAAGTARQ